ncbi:putative cytochrome P450 [Polychaeton citri CBS 116435]|uniref:Cytochrome P450 n=1 Tax=Polychaeton citri CBS 116435 TaxID=1314669 RepID=A0A9P4QD22_9PEZI|nr:putative cytochrome P450 [Polychaeton citri CBS 116435]
MPTFNSTLIATVGGVATHFFYFHRGEHFLQPLRYVGALLLGISVGGVLLVQHYDISAFRAIVVSLQHAGIFLAGLYTSLLLYRAFFNPLNHFPGPFMARFTKFDHVIRNRKYDGHHVLHRLHQKYGKFVRIGPNDLSVTDPDGTQVVSAPNSRCTKSPWYAQDTPLISMHTTRDRAMHDRRRRIWSPAFSDRALRGYEERVQVYNDKLIQRIEASNGRPIQANKWLNLFSFDVMGDLGFGKSFEMLDKGETHWAIKLLGAGMDPLGLQIPQWLFRTILAIPGAAGEYFTFIDFCNKQLAERMDAHGKKAEPDICHTLIDQYNTASDKKTLLPMLQGDCRLLIVAGSDTTATTLTHLFFHIACNLDWQDLLRDEIRKHTDGKPILDQAIRDGPILNGMINEALRLNPPVPSGVFRKTPPEGVTIGQTFVPGETVIQMPQYAIGHDEDSYERCEEFLPQRWYGDENLIKHKDAFSPFSSGPFGCIGKNLAYMEIRTVTARILDKFNVALAPGEDGTELLTKSVDHFTVGLGDLWLCFTRRQNVS